MDIKYGSEYFEQEPNEELGAMSLPLIGEPSGVKPSVARGILEQLEGDIQKVAEVNKKNGPISKSLLAHFMRITNNAKKETENKRKEENGT